MTKNEARAFVNSLVGLRASATDEQAVGAPAVYPAWKEDIPYTTNDRVLYNEVLYRVLQDHTSQAAWTPANAPSLFAQVLIPDPEVIPEWVQPDSTNPYMIGDKVIYNGIIYISIVDNNVWAPDVHGWEVYQN